MTSPASVHPVLESLTQRQREAATHVNGPLLIVAGPGSGKTRVMAHRIAYLIAAEGISPYRILAVTFTNKAARELRERCERLVGVSGLGLQVRTFHSFCAQLLRTDGAVVGLDSNYSIYDEDDQERLVRRVLEEFEIDPKRFPPRAILAAISDAKNRMIEAKDFSASAGSYFEEIVGRVYRRYQELLLAARAADFDDLLLTAHRLFEHHPDVLARYHDRFWQLLIDEFQDTNALQFGLARMLAARNRNICVVGDPNQSIYSWRHADPRNMLDFKNYYPDARAVTLDQNYRSTQMIIESAAALISNNRGRLRNDLWTENEKGMPIVVAEAFDEEDEARLVLQEVARLVNEDRIPRRNIAVMYRVNAQSRALEVACNRHGIAYQLVGGLKFYERREIKDLLAYLRLTVNPADDVSFERIVNVPARGISERTVSILKQIANRNGRSMFEALTKANDPQLGLADALNKRAVTALADFLAMVQELVERSLSASPAEMVDFVVERTRYKRYIEGDEETRQERWENILELRASAEPFGGNDPHERLLDFLQNVALVSDVDTMDGGNGDALTLITLHQAKGLEFDAVFIVGLEQGLLPHSRSMEDPAQLEEERRICYVGMTRARKRLYMLRAYKRGFRVTGLPSLPSQFLDELPATHVRGRSGSRHDGRGAEQIRDPLSTRRAVAVPLPPPAAPKESFAPGDRVRHEKFGDGVVVNATPSNGDTEITVAFSGQGVKRLLQSFARLQRVQR
ncbi:MAG: UvrD-helicase domain-containing protein [Chloroflexi bacterium]|nr:UvrD-helicase domain-containing protein [Chloroflexota bacterium]